MTVALRAVGAVTAVGTSSVNVAYPTNAVGDVLVLAIANTNVQPSAPAGWTAIATSAGQKAVNTRVYYLRVTSVLTGNLALTGASGHTRAAIASFSGVRPSSDGAPTTASAIGSGSVGANPANVSCGPINALAPNDASVFTVAVASAQNRTWSGEAASGITSPSTAEILDSSGPCSLLMWRVSGTGNANSTVSTAFSGTMSNIGVWTAIYFDLVGESIPVTAAADLPAPAALDAAATVVAGAVSAAVDLRAPAALVAAATVVATGAAGLAAPAVLVAAGTQIQPAAADLAAPAALATAPVRVIPAAAVLAAPAALTAAGSRTAVAAAELLAPGALAGAASVSRFAQVVLAAPAALVIAAALTRDASSDLAAAALLVAVATVQLPAHDITLTAVLDPRRVGAGLAGQPDRMVHVGGLRYTAAVGSRPVRTATLGPRRAVATLEPQP